MFEEISASMAIPVAVPLGFASAVSVFTLDRVVSEALPPNLVSLRNDLAGIPRGDISVVNAHPNSKAAESGPNLTQGQESVRMVSRMLTRFI